MNKINYLFEGVGVGGWVWVRLYVEDVLTPTPTPSR
jgi:hypothetical protein